MAIKFIQKGDFSNFERYLKRSRKITRINQQAGLIGETVVDRLKKATPKDSGLTAESWDYEIEINGKKTSIIFYNYNVQNGMNVALLLDFGHGTPTGGWVEGKEYIDPVVQQVYLDVLNNTWKELTKL